ncbi:exonuclease SbcCD subunit D [Cohnella suwonensis]|uniref:Exonuclease SbcCD subunit D n=1 Tax=Cohnella suwonensis TaxID=696072 RepID=A0ABW0LVY5_9BACL
MTAAGRGDGVAFTFVHAADLHLDSPFAGLSKAPQAVRDRLRESTFAALRGLCGLVRQERPDFVVIAGDLFDAADRSLRAQLRLQRALADIVSAGCGVFVVHGNHDPESGRRAKLDWPEGVHAFGSSDVECRPAYNRQGELVAHVYGISYATAAVADNLALRFNVREGAPFHLALLHANVDGDSKHDNYAPCKLEELSAAGFDYWALGHVHDRRVLREYPHVVYPGNTQGRSVKETGPKGAYVVSVSDSGRVEMKFRELADVLWRETAVSIEGIGTEQELKQRLLEAAENLQADAAGRPVVARFRLEGRGPLHEKLLQPSVAEEWLEELREWLGSPEETEGWVWPDSVVIRTGGAWSLETAADDEGFLGELLRIGQAASNDEALSRTLLEEAADSLMTQPRLREWLRKKTHEERSAWIRQAMELSASYLREGEADGA